jgi:hypothetical protein
MSKRATHDLPVPILTDEELLAEYDHTFRSMLGNDQSERSPATAEDAILRRNSATMGELLRRGYRSTSPRWHRTQTR